MCQTYDVSLVTIWKRMNDIVFDKNYSDNIEAIQDIVLLIDTTYFGRKYWYMIFRAWFPKEKKGKNLLWYKVPYETNEMYRKWMKELQEKWRNIIAIVCDWRQWLLWWFWGIPTQMCLAHMKQIVVRLLTKKPKLKQNKQLKNIAACIWEYPQEDIKCALDVWCHENKERLNEKNDKWNYMHIKTRKAYKSITKKLSYCYTFHKHSDLWIPKTNNSLESINSHLKTKIWIHRWLKEDKKDKFTSFYLWLS